jgi:hypothetical protein
MALLANRSRNIGPVAAKPQVRRRAGRTALIGQY